MDVEFTEAGAPPVRRERRPEDAIPDTPENQAVRADATKHAFESLCASGARVSEECTFEGPLATFRQGSQGYAVLAM